MLFLGQILRVTSEAFLPEIHPPEMLALHGQSVRLIDWNRTILVTKDNDGETWGLYPSEVEEMEPEYSI